MKRLRICCALLLLCSLICLMRTAWTEAEPMSIRALREASSPEWRQQYETLQGVMEVDCPVTLPSVETFPILTARKMPPLSEERARALQAAFTAPKDESLPYDFQTSAYGVSLLHASLGVWDAQRGETPSRVGQRTRSLEQYDMNEAYADANPLPLGEAVQIAKAALRRVYPEAEAELLEVGLADRLRVKATEEPLREKGSYLLLLRQSIRDIPILANVEEAYAQLGDMPMAFAWNQTRGKVRAEVWDAEHYGIHAVLYEETGILCEDAALLPFTAVKPQLDALIEAGQIRKVLHAGLGYAQYSASFAEPERYVLAPTWVFWCIMVDENAPAEPAAQVNGTGFAFEQMGYRPILIDAVTGKMMDPWTQNHSLVVYHGEEKQR